MHLVLHFEHIIPTRLDIWLNSRERSEFEHEKLWLAKSDQPIYLKSNVTCAALREKLAKIIGSDYLKMTPQMKATAEAAENFVFLVPVQVESSVTQREQKIFERIHSSPKKTRLHDDALSRVYAKDVHVRMACLNASKCIPAISTCYVPQDVDIATSIWIALHDLEKSVAEVAEDVWDRYDHEFGTNYSGLFKALSHVNYMFERLLRMH